MNDPFILVLAWLAGLLLGAVFFGGLWWTVRRGVASARPAVWFLVSLLLRLAIVLAGFYFVGQGDWRRLMACLVGFVIVRIFIARFSLTSAKEVLHEPQS